MTERWDETYAHFTAENPKMIYYLSMEFLQARPHARLRACGACADAPLLRRAARCSTPSATWAWLASTARR